MIVPRRSPPGSGICGCVKDLIHPRELALLSATFLLAAAFTLFALGSVGDDTVELLKRWRTQPWEEKACKIGKAGISYLGDCLNMSDMVVRSIHTLPKYDFTDCPVEVPPSCASAVRTAFGDDTTPLARRLAGLGEEEDREVASSPAGGPAGFDVAFDLAAAAAVGAVGASAGAGSGAGAERGGGGFGGGGGGGGGGAAEAAASGPAAPPRALRKRKEFGELCRNDFAVWTEVKLSRADDSDMACGYRTGLLVGSDHSDWSEAEDRLAELQGLEGRLEPCWRLSFRGEGILAMHDCHVVALEEPELWRIGNDTPDWVSIALICGGAWLFLLSCGAAILHYWCWSSGIETWAEFPGCRDAVATFLVQLSDFRSSPSRWGGGGSRAAPGSEAERTRTVRDRWMQFRTSVLSQYQPIGSARAYAPPGGWASGGSAGGFGGGGGGGARS